MSVTTVARRVRAIPYRASGDAWSVITALLVPHRNKAALDEFAAVAGIASTLIGSEIFANAPLVVWGAGLRVRVYCVYGDDAITGDDANEASLPSNPTDGDWKLSMPAPKEDIEWIRESLTKKSVARIVVRDADEPVDDDDEKTSRAVAYSGDFQVNEEVFRKL